MSTTIGNHTIHTELGTDGIALFSALLDLPGSSGLEYLSFRDSGFEQTVDAMEKLEANKEKAAAAMREIANERQEQDAKRIARALIFRLEGSIIDAGDDSYRPISMSDHSFNFFVSVWS
jgi:hypothetical protein